MTPVLLLAEVAPFDDEYAPGADWVRTADAALTAFPDVPLLHYRVGVCGGERDIPRLRALRAAHPEFVDADYALARQAVGDREAPDQEDALRRFALDNGPAYAHPRAVWFVDELPLAGTNKIDRKTLLERAAANYSREGGTRRV